MSTYDLNARLKSLFDAHKQTVHLINRLAKLPAQPGSAPLNPDSADARSELSTEIHQSLKEQEEDFEILRQEVEDQTISTLTTAARRKDTERERERTDLSARVTRLGENLSTARSQFRKAQLQAKRNVEAAKRKERELLFTGQQEGNDTASSARRKRNADLSKEDQLLDAAQDVTGALRQTKALIGQELSKSQFARETLDESTAVLQNLSQNYLNIDTLLSSSRTLVSSLLHSRKSDTWYLESAFWLLVTTIGWLIFRRILYGPGWWLLYLPPRLAWRLIIFNTQVLLSLFATIAGSVGGTKQSNALSQASERISTSLIVQPSAAGDFPRFQPNMPKPSIAVGAGGSGAKAPQSGHESQRREKSLSEQVGEMAEKSQQEQQASSASASSEGASQGTVLRERSSDEPPNPKKRMFEEKPPEPTEETQQRDEL